jgi:hypothetical protein
MTGGQSNLSLDSEESARNVAGDVAVKKIATDRKPIKIISASDEELLAHQAIIEKMGAKLAVGSYPLSERAKKSKLPCIETNTHTSKPEPYELLFLTAH